MKILMMRPSYNPEMSAGNHLAQDLIEDLQKAGNNVEIITPVSESFEGLPEGYNDPCVVHRVKSSVTGRSIIKRILRYIGTSFSMYKEAKNIDCDLIISHSMPPLLGPLSCVLSRKKKKPVVYWEQDIVSNSIISTGMGSSNSAKQKVMFKAALLLEKYTEKHCTHIVTISEQFKKMHTDRGVRENKVTVLYNWIDTNHIYPKDRADNPLFEELGLSRDDFIVSYCGNLGIPQNVEIMIDVAEKLKDISGLKFLIIGNGSREKVITEYIQKKNLSNLTYHPLYPLSQACDVYNIGDVGLVIGKKGTSGNGFPSKMWSILAAGQTMISCFDIGSELSGFVREGGCGISIEPDSAEKLAEAIETLYKDRDFCNQCHLNARKFAVEHAERVNATRKFVDVVDKVGANA